MAEWITLSGSHFLWKSRAPVSTRRWQRRRASKSERPAAHHIHISARRRPRDAAHSPDPDRYELLDRNRAFHRESSPPGNMSFLLKMSIEKRISRNGVWKIALGGNSESGLTWSLPFHGRYPFGRSISRTSLCVRRLLVKYRKFRPGRSATAIFSSQHH